MTKKRPRRVGLGMKPRQTPVNTAVSTELEVPVSDVEVSGTAAQEEAVKEAVVEGSEVVESGVPLASGGVQNLDSQVGEIAEEIQNEAIVAQKPDFYPPLASFAPDVPVEEVYSGDALAEMLKKSKEVTESNLKFTVKPIPGREFSNFGGPTEEQLARSIYEDGKTDPREFAGMETTRMITFEEAAKMGLPSIEGADGYFIINGKPYGAGIDVGHPVPLSRDVPGINGPGELPNGDYRATVRIGEVYVEGCKQQAEADGISLEDWLSLHLGSYLENWWSAPGQK